MTNHKKLINVTASLDWNWLSFTKEKVYCKNRSVCKKCLEMGLKLELHAPTHRLLTEYTNGNLNKLC